MFCHQPDEISAVQRQKPAENRLYEINIVLYEINIRLYEINIWLYDIISHDWKSLKTRGVRIIYLKLKQPIIIYDKNIELHQETS